MSEPRSILVCDDEDHLARGIAENLVAEGYAVTTVGDGLAALNRISSPAATTWCCSTS